MISPVFQRCHLKQQVEISAELRNNLTLTLREICFLNLSYYSDAGLVPNIKQSYHFLSSTVEVKIDVNKIINKCNNKELKNDHNRANEPTQEVIYLKNFT